MAGDDTCSWGNSGLIIASARMRGNPRKSHQTMTSVNLWPSAETQICCGRLWGRGYESSAPRP
jgi:hypothetical protein